MLKEKQNGITLISLVITIVVLLIIAGVAISIAVDSNGIFGRARYAADAWNKSMESEETTINNSLEILDEINVGRTKKVQITKDNYKDYLGKVVTNFRSAETGETEEVNGYTVGTTYRLYYVDFEGKYGEKGTVYLKTDCTDNTYVLPITDTTDVDDTKMKELNPGLYKDKDGEAIDPPEDTQNNMKAVKWLLNPTNWESLKESSPIKDSVNYVVGAPSLEMMMDSYNTYYNLTEDTPDYSEITPGERRTLFYKYVVGDRGYKVGPCAEDESEYGYYTSENSVYTDGPDGIDEMYYPGSGHHYWLASPSAGSYNNVVTVFCYYGNNVTSDRYADRLAFCPLVSLDSSVQLEFTE